MDQYEEQLLQQYGLEAEDLGPDPSPDFRPNSGKVVKKKGGGWLGRIIALLLGVVVGVGACCGGVFLVLSSPTRPLIETVGGFAGINYDEQVKNKFLAEQYEGKTLLEVGQTVADAVAKKNLAGLNEIAPVIGDYLGGMIDNMNSQFGINLNANELMSTEFSQLPNYLGETFRVTPLGSMLKATSGSQELAPLLMEICYGEEGTNYVYDENGEIVMINGSVAATFETLGADTNSLINKVTLASVVSIPTDDPVMLALGYGKKDITYTIVKDETGAEVVDMLPMYFLKDGDLFIDHDGNPVAGNVLGTEGEYTIFEKTPTYEGGATIVYYLKDDGTGKYFAHIKNEDSYQPVDFKKTVIGDIQDSSIIDDIYLGDALGVKVDAYGNINQHRIIVDLAYGAEGVDWEIGTDENGNPCIKMLGNSKPRTIGELKERNTDLINEIQIADIMSASHNDRVVMYLLYGKEGIHYTLDSEDNVIMLQQRIILKEDLTTGDIAVYNEYGESYIPQTATQAGYVLDTTAKTYTNVSGQLFHYTEAKTTTEGNIKTIECLLFDAEGNPVNYQPHNLGDLTGGDNLVSRMTDRLTVLEVLGEKDVAQNKFLKHIGHCTIGEMPNAVLDLSIGQIFESDIYKAANGNNDGTITTDGIYKYTGDVAFTALIKGSEETTTIHKGEFFEIAGGVKYAYTLQESDIAPTWKYLLTDKTTGTINTEYKVSTDMNRLLENMTHNVHVACLDDLHKDEIIDFGADAELLLNTTVRKSIGTESITLDGIPEGTRLGALTTTQMLSYTSALLQAVNTLFPPAP